jgi:ABC-2 type transport system permease protein
VERARVTPVSRVALLLGRSLRDVVMLMIQAAIIVVLSIPLGLFVKVQDLLLAYVTLGLITLTSASLSYGISLRINDPNVLAQIINNVAQPLWLLSGTLLPIALAPLWMRDIANFIPFSWAVNGMRALYAGHDGAASIWQGIAFAAGAAVLVVSWSARQFAKAVR